MNWLPAYSEKADGRPQPWFERLIILFNRGLKTPKHLDWSYILSNKVPPDSHTDF